ncbi:MAG: hypothetical protein U0892_08120 [Pirellulales bacterium]
MNSTTCSNCGRTIRVDSEQTSGHAKCPCGAKVKLTEPPASSSNDYPITDQLLPVGPTAGSNENGAESDPSLSSAYAPTFTEGAMHPATISSVDPELKNAKWILIVVGLINVALYVFQIINAQSEVNKLIAAGEIPAEAAESFLIGIRIFFGLFAAAGAAMTILGFGVLRFPRTCTVLGLLLYLGINGIMLLLDPAGIGRNIIFKILIIFGLFKAVSSAFRNRA